MRMANTVKLNGVRPEVIKLQLFPFLLRDVAATWFESLPIESMTNWEELVEAYMGRFFPPALTLERRGEIIVFKLGDDESLYCSTPLRSNPIGGSEPIPGCSFNSFYLSFY